MTALLLLLLACGGETTAEPDETPDAEVPAEAPADAPKKKKKSGKSAVPKSAWVGDWVKGDMILSTTKSGDVKLMQDGDVVMTGPMEGKGLKRTAPLDGCGATMKLSEVGGDITLGLNGPECPVDFIGTYINTVSP